MIIEFFGIYISKCPSIRAKKTPGPAHMMFSSQNMKQILFITDYFTPCSNSNYISKINILDLRDHLWKIWKIYFKCFVNFWAREMFFFLDRSEFRQKFIGNVISELRRQKCV